MNERTIETRTERKVRLKDANTKAGEFKSKDINYQAKKLQVMHSRRKDAIDARVTKAKELGTVIPAILNFDIDKAMKSLLRKTKKYFGATSKWQKPHQGKQECLRRCRVGSPAYYSGIEMNKRIGTRGV